MAAGTPSKDYQFVLIREDFDAFRSKAAAVKEVKRKWANQEPRERVGWFVAKVETYYEPDYEIKADPTAIADMP